MKFYFIYKNDKLKGAHSLSDQTVTRLTLAGYTLIETAAPKF